KMKTQAELNPGSAEKLQHTLRSISIDIPENMPIKIETHHIPSPSDNNQNIYSQTSANEPTTVSVQQVAATINDTLIFPNAPHSPNTNSGMILDTQGNSVENAIIEVTDQYNMPVR